MVGRGPWKKSFIAMTPTAIHLFKMPIGCPAKEYATILQADVVSTKCLCSRITVPTKHFPLSLQIQRQRALVFLTTCDMPSADDTEFLLRVRRSVGADIRLRL